MMEDPFDVRSEGDLRVTCQVVLVSHRDGATLIDLVTIEPCVWAEVEVPAGTPFTVGFQIHYVQEDAWALGRVVSGWEMSDAIVVLEVNHLEDGIAYQFTDGDEQLLLVLSDLPPAR